jgi:hypothetical protein
MNIWALRATDELFIQSYHFRLVAEPQQFSVTTGLLCLVQYCSRYGYSNLLHVVQFMWLDCAVDGHTPYR